MGGRRMSNWQFFWAVFFGWTMHSAWAAMRRMQREIEREELRNNRDKFYR
jgi:hypothetical protein